MSQHNHQHWKHAISPTIGKMLKNSKAKPLATRKPLKIINTTMKHKSLHKILCFEEHKIVWIYIDHDPEEQGALCVSTLRSRTAFSSTCGAPPVEEAERPPRQPAPGLRKRKPCQERSSSGKLQHDPPGHHMVSPSPPLGTIWFLHRCAGLGLGLGLGIESSGPTLTLLEPRCSARARSASSPGQAPAASRKLKNAAAAGEAHEGTARL